MVIGTQKGGTTALHSYLSKHHCILPGRRKEIHFFDQDVAYNKGTAWYHGQFPLTYRLARKAITYDCTPSYMYYPACAERIFSYDPQMKLVALLRDPVERAFSAWNMFRQLATTNFKLNDEYYDRIVCDGLNEMLSADEFIDFDAAVQEEIDRMLIVNSGPEPSFVRYGLYHEQLRRYLNYFEREQLLITDSRLLRSDPALLLREVTQFLGLPDYDWSQIEYPLVAAGSYEGEMSPETRTYLSEFYKPHNEDLYELLGHDFAWE